MSTTKILWYIAGCTAMAAALVVWVRNAGEPSEGARSPGDPAILVSAMLKQLSTDDSMDQPATRAAVQAVANLAADGTLPSAEGFYALGLVLTHNQDIAAAEQALRRAVALRPQWSWPYNALGILLGNYRPDRIAEAEQSFRKAIELDPDWSRPHNDLAILLRIAKRYEEAEKEARLALKLAPDDVATHNNYGNLLVVQGRLEEAEKEYLKAIEIDPSHPKPYYNLACTYARLGKKEQALSLLEKSVALRPALRADAQVDPDFEKLRGDPEFVAIAGPQ